MWVVSLLTVLILLFSLFGGLKEGAVKQFFSLVALLIAIPLAGISYRLPAALLSFLPGQNWENFLGFFIALVVISIILHFVFFLPRKFARKVWNKGLLFRLLGGALNILNSAIGLVLFALVVTAYPIFHWLQQAVTASSVLGWLVESMGFVPAMLPEVFKSAVPSFVTAMIRLLS